MGSGILLANIAFCRESQIGAGRAHIPGLAYAINPLGGINPLTCRFYTVSNPKAIPIFALSIRLKLKFISQYEKFIQNTSSP